MQFKILAAVLAAMLLTACMHEHDSAESKPVADSRNLELLEDGSVDFTLAGTAVNGGELTYQIVDSVPAEAGNLYLTAQGDGRFEANPDFYGTTRFTFTVSEGQKTAKPATVTIDVKSTPDLVSARYKNAIASDSSEPWVLLETPSPKNSGVIISADGITNLDRAFELVAEHEDGDEVTFSVVEESLPAGIGFNPDGTGTINTGTTGTGHFSFHVVIHGKNGISAPIPVNINTSYLIPGPTLWMNYQIDALNPMPLEWTRFRLGEAGSRAILALSLTNMNSADWVTNFMEFSVHFGGIDAVEPDKVVLSVYAPNPFEAMLGSFPPALIKGSGGSTVTFTQADFNAATLLLVVENLGPSEDFAFDLTVLPELKRTLRGELYDIFGGISIPKNSIVFSPLGSVAEELNTGINVRCNDIKCELDKPSTGETGQCGYATERGVGYPTCTFLNGSGEITSTCIRHLTYNCYMNINVSGGVTIGIPEPLVIPTNSPSIGIPEPLVIPTNSPSIEVTVPDGGTYIGGDGATYLGSIVTPARRALLEAAISGSVSQLYMDTFLAEFRTYVNSNPSVKQSVADYTNYLVGINLPPGETLTKLLDDLSNANGSDNESAATVLMTLLPKWVVELARHPRDQLISDEVALVATAMHHINDRREQLVSAAESNLASYRQSQRQCLTLSCLFTVAGFPAVIQQSVTDVDTAWIGSLATGAVVGTAAGAALVAVTITAQTTALFILPHTAAAAMTALGAGAASAGTIAAFAALPVTVVVIAAVSTYMAVDNLFQAGENEQAYNTFINDNSGRFTNLDDFINHDYVNDDRVLSEIVIACQKMLLETAM